MTKILRDLRNILQKSNYSLFHVNIRPVATALSVQIEEKQSKYDKSTAINSIEKSLCVSRRKALKLVNENRKLLTTSLSIISENSEILQNNGFTSGTVLKYPHLLWTDELKRKMKALSQLEYPLSTTIVLAGLSMDQLNFFIRSCKEFADRIFVLSNLLQISPIQTCELIYKCQFLLKKNLVNIRDIVLDLKEFGISMADVHSDPWVLMYSHTVIKEQIMFLKKSKIEFIRPKPWLLRASMKAIENYHKRRQETREILGNASLTEYLCQRLECSEDQAKYLFSKIPALQKKSTKTLSEIIDFLYSKGFEPFHIYRVPKILVHSVETTKLRIEQMRNAGIKVNSLSLLTKSQKQFTQQFESLVKAKKQFDSEYV